MRDEQLYNRFGNERISARQIDELIGLARGLCADGVLNQAEVEYLQKWLAANADVSNEPLIGALYHRINEILKDGVADTDERAALFDALNTFSTRDFELGETLKSSTIPLCDPAPALIFSGRSYCFTGTFNFGRRAQCEATVIERGGKCASLTKSTDVLVIGVYATESWKHSSFGNKILKACELRDSGLPIAIVSEEHWASHLL